MMVVSAQESIPPDNGTHRLLELPWMIAPLGAWLILLGSAASGETTTPAPIVLSGQVVELTDALKAKGLPSDAEPIAKQVVLRGKDNTLTPLLCDDASRAFF